MSPTRFRFLFCVLAAAAFLPWGDSRAQDSPEDDLFGQDGAGDADAEWPREVDATTATIVVYQPQIDGYENGVLEAHCALAITPAGATEPVFGAVWFKARMESDRDSRVCTLVDVQVPNARFPESTPGAEAKLAEIIRREIPGWVHPMSMDRLLPALEAVEKRSASDERLRNDAPRIIVETVPAMLVPIDGEAQLAVIPGSRIKRVLNTPAAVLFEPASRTWWIDAGASWIYASSVDGPYRAAATPPAEIAAVETSNAEQRSAAPGADAGPPPKIVVAHEPAELLAFDGPPRWKELPGGELSYATNTTSAVFSSKSDDRVYVLLSGRWFRAASLLDGPWEFVPPGTLPGAFREIPEDSEMGGVLAHVAGTDLANEALLDAEIPQTKAIRRDAATCSVVYDGEPRFEAVPSTGLRYAVNTASQVLDCNGRYYCCDQGVWFVSNSPRGPWTLADDVPTSFAAIPPESPCYNVKFVHVYDATPEVVYVGYTPGYLGWYAWDGVVVWGTGWRYTNWFGASWYPRCATWGVSVGFNPWAGAWYEGLSFRWGPRWSIGIRISRGWGWGGAWWGPGGYRPWRRHDGEFHRPVAWARGFDRGEPGGGHRHGPSVYDSPRNEHRNAPDRTAAGRLSRAPDRAAASSSGRSRNDVFLDRDGRIFRRGSGGDWHERDGKDWRQVPRDRLATPRDPTPDRSRVQRPPVRPAPTPQLGRDARARDRGNVRSNRGGGSGRGGGRRR